jgi:hypothetical protein
MPTLVEAVEAEAKKIEGEVVAVAEKVIEKVTQELSAEEKLGIREIENAYLKATLEVTRLTQITTKAQADFTKTVEDLTKKYAINPAVWVFDNVLLTFRKK